MNKVILTLNQDHKGLFQVRENGHRVAEMSIKVADHNLIINHTRIADDSDNKESLARILLTAMAIFARKHSLKVLSFCPFTLDQFNRHRESYADIWAGNASGA
jgi:predicted GNAT family acetyltransferase